MQTMPNGIGVLHFVGIGGIGMSGIAEIFDTLGFTVQGSDQSDNANVQRLKGKGIKVSKGHSADNLVSASGEAIGALVVSSAIKNDNPEVLEARAKGVPVVRRAEMLAELMRMKSSIAVGGTHGKTTTTSMIGQMLETADFDPTVINGGIVNAYGSNTRLGQGDWLVAEADESDGTFTRLPAQIVTVTNMDAEHMEHYGTFENVRNAYLQFIHNLPFYGYAVMCTDHAEVQALIPEIKDRRVITYGFNPQADVRASNVRSDAEGNVFDVTFADGSEIKDIYLSMLGRHNVQNSLIALAIAKEMDVPVATMKRALANFSGVKRRFTKTGEVNGITIIDDYAHHPVEIETVLKTARTAIREPGGRIICVTQPHRYSRLQDLFEDFCKCYNLADKVIVADVYAAGEQPINGADKDVLVEGIRRHGHRDVVALSAPDDLANMLSEDLRAGDLVVCMGAGDITAWAYELPKSLETLSNSSKGNAA